MLLHRTNQSVKSMTMPRFELSKTYERKPNWMWETSLALLLILALLTSSGCASRVGTDAAIGGALGGGTGLLLGGPEGAVAGGLLGAGAGALIGSSQGGGGCRHHCGRTYNGNGNRD